VRKPVTKTSLISWANYVDARTVTETKHRAMTFVWRQVTGM